MIRQVDALLSYHFKIPFPEELDDETWAEKFKQIEWLAKKEILGPKQE